MSRSFQAQPAGLAQQAAADGGRADLRDIEFDEGIGLVAAFRARGGIVAAGGAEGLVHVGHAQAQLAHRAVVEQGLPGADLARRLVDRARLTRAVAACAGRAALPTPWARATAMAERVMLSPITISVTVAPLTMSTGGGALRRGGVSTKFRPT